MNTHPYRDLPAPHFWRKSVTGVAPEAFDPVTAMPFSIGPGDRVAAAGSCFAQHIARNLTAAGFDFLRTEQVEDFSAAFGNIYTARQLHQLMLRAYGLLRPVDSAWQLPTGRWVDPFRPQMLGNGLDDADAVATAREPHLAAVRTMFEECSVFIFTLGLTEAWLAADGAALPVPPGVLGVSAGASDARFHNFGLDEIIHDLETFLVDLVLVNPSVRVVFTVSPVALAATYEDRHVLVSNTLSKATLRLAAEAMRARHGRVCYFPSYEIVTAPQNLMLSLEPDLRSVAPEGVARVMAVFNRHMLGAGTPMPAAPAPEISAERRAEFEDRARIICDEELLAQ
ncbi:MAG: GSCFA domain-containing protein [Rubritepida sp.]|nr:GSCFA domain-containing protein [Rubritepida sp.]